MFPSLIYPLRIFLILEKLDLLDHTDICVTEAELRAGLPNTNVISDIRKCKILTGQILTQIWSFRYIATSYDNTFYQILWSTQGLSLLTQRHRMTVQYVPMTSWKQYCGRFDWQQICSGGFQISYLHSVIFPNFSALSKQWMRRTSHIRTW